MKLSKLTTLFQRLSTSIENLMMRAITFANTNGGIIFIGVANADFVVQQISNSLRESIRSDVSMFANIELL